MKEKWKRIWGEGDNIAVTFLEENGYSLTRSFCWSHSNPEHIPTPKELDAVDYLKKEWGYRGIR